MERTRRDVLGLAGMSMVALTAGCLGGSGPGEPTPADEATASPTASPTDEPQSGLPDGLERVDEPPYEITVPACGSVEGSTPSERDPLYLCANMPAEPSLSFTQATARGSILADAGLERGDESNSEMSVTLLTAAADRDRVTDDVDGGPGELIEAADFGSQAVLVVETGWGSGSLVPHVKRVEATDTGVHAFGCHSDPCVMTADYTSRTVAVRFERPDRLETAIASLTVDAEERWNVAAGEGVVTIP